MLTFGPLLLIVMAAIPGRIANRNVNWLNRWALFATFFVFIDLLLASAMNWVENGSQHPGGVFYWLNTWVSASVMTIYLDAITITMGLLISFIGLIIIRYSHRYLDGDSHQGHFLKWMGFTLGSVLLMVLTGQLLVFAICWMMTSLGLHQLLTFYGDRKAGVVSAWKKFAISRFGDVMILSAIGLIYFSYESLSYAAVFAEAAERFASGAVPSGIDQCIGVLLALGAISKSAQFPFHTWLPDTMESPTPVSALMHAGIINAGGFLMIRMSPLVAPIGLAMLLLVVIGGVTAVMAATVAMSQTSVKRGLAFSTIAQMGFMILQCGLGAYSAALLHIVAHSIYKAYAFLNSGSVLEHRTGRSTLPSQSSEAGGRVSWLGFGLAVCISLMVASGWVLGALWSLGLSQKIVGGGQVLVVIVVLGLTHLLLRSILSGQRILLYRGLAFSLLISFAYAASFALFQQITRGTVIPVSVALSGWQTLFTVSFGGAFLALLLLQQIWERGGQPAWLQGFYVHSHNGFYIDVMVRRMVGWVWPAFLRLA